MIKLLNFLDLLIGFRKFSIMLIVFFISLVLLLMKVISADNWTTLIQSVAVAYFASNSVEHLSQFAQNFIKNKLEQLKK